MHHTVFTYKKMFLNAVIEEKLWGAQNFQTTGILGAQHFQYAYIKKVFFPVTPRPNLVAWHTHNVHNNLFYFI